MEIKNRLFPYPVLCLENDDYVDSSFDVTTKMTEELSDIVLTFDIKIKECDELEWMVRDGFADYVIHIECSSTAFRTAISFSGNKVVHHIAKSRLNNEISLLAMIVAKKNIVKFSSRHLNEDYVDEHISFDKGSILAYINLPKIYITKNYEELTADTPFFSVVKRTSEVEGVRLPVIYDLNGPKIKILIDEYTYNEYSKYQSNKIMEPLINSLIVMPAIIYMINELRDNDIDDYKSYYWFQRFKKFFQLQNKNFEDVINSNQSMMEIVQEMLQLPIARAFESLTKIIEE